MDEILESEVIVSSCTTIASTDTNTMDDDDKHIFRFTRPELSDKIIRMKHNDTGESFLLWFAKKVRLDNFLMHIHMICILISYISLLPSPYAQA